MTNFLKHLCATILLLTLAACAGSMPTHGENYSPSNDPLADVSATIARARAEEKLALIILGANWCHDSRALASRLSQSPMLEVTDRKYVTTLVDVGYYEQGQDVMRMLGEEIYYATPSVLIVDPQSRQVINNHDRHQWGSAASISMDESVNYFRDINSSGHQLVDPTRDVIAGLEKVQKFEAAQAKRVAAGYKVVGPMLAVLDQSGTKHEEFDARWRELAGFRNGLARDISKLRQAVLEGQAPEQSLAELAAKYPKLSWEQ